MVFMVFDAPTVEIFPSDDQKLWLEKVFCSVRSIHNLFVTQLQSLTDEEAKRMVRTYSEVKTEIVNLVDCPETTYEYLNNLDRSILNSHVQIISCLWDEFTKDARLRPPFRHARHDQSFWILDARKLRVTRDSVTIPGPIGLQLVIPQGVFKGPPTACKVTRDKKDRYWLSFLYESEASAPEGDNIVTVWGIRLKDTLERLKSPACRAWKPGRRSTKAVGYEYTAAILRMKILGKIVNGKQKRKNHESHENQQSFPHCTRGPLPAQQGC